MAFSSSLALKKASQLSVPASTISAAPSLLPYPPLSAPPPALSPDIAPLFPSPGGSELSPSESSMPTIPSSPSPPNPDAIAAPGPGFAFPPERLQADSSAVALNLQGCVCFILVLSLVAF
ncbi:classical arabinogalactan 26-like [Olea europaea subsp. europaea]|uniref:Classical arabinogalactan 26-like n=1 Tax=Olea europaea subsp. europaea TaxID=158383 RepID=A0A8S0RJ01_OLEEU|nr:classical arabinogalactan 26-like [Olea europaea subsp. europaea]